ncbi:MAG: stage II sporulation protein P [Clostridia bacterium]|nr:stage II sporulation protein P [Clostridia bacterium]
MPNPSFCPYPEEVHREGTVSPHVRKPKFHIPLKPLTFPWQERPKYWAMTGVFLVGIAVVCVGVGLSLTKPSGSGSSPILPAVSTGQADAETAPQTETENSRDPSFVTSEEPTEESCFPEPDTEERWTETIEESPSEAATESPPETGRQEGTESPPASTTPQEPSEDPAETVAPGGAEGWIPVLSQDVSEVDCGVGHVEGEIGRLPAQLPTGDLWKKGAPAVLVVNTHPYEGFSDGSSLYDPASGGLAVTETLYDSDGMVAFASALTRTLRGMGFTVIHLRVPASAGESAGEIYDRTESMIRYYCRLYSDIGLVLDLRRSAELTEGGEILRTAGCYGGEDCAQLRISVNGGKSEAAFAGDLKVALALRAAMWGEEPTISRPVRIKSGQGLIADLSDVRVLTLEAGSAGNTYAEAERLLSPLASAVAKILETP